MTLVVKQRRRAASRL
uniref:Uncharacterized protein n=1 Tax=Anguilla anguilla TaxID=7936 RepID=A0A0E9USQ9_ANGAN